MSYPSRYGRVLPWALGLQAASLACTLTAGDFNPGLAGEPGTCALEPCGAGGGAAELPGGSLAAAGSAESTPSAPRPEEGIGGSLAIDGPTDDTPATGSEPLGSDAGALQPEPIEPPPTLLIGWASAAGLGLATTTGGGAGETVVADTADALLELAARPEPLVIRVTGTLDVPRLEIASNKTLRGADGGATLRGGVRVRGGGPDDLLSNVIIQNIEIDAVSSDAEGDGIQIHYAHHVWIDHCTIRDAADGLLDVVHGSDFVTLSFNRLFYTDAAPAPDHRFAHLIGHSANNSAEDSGHLNVTLHHNFFGAGVSEAISARFGRVHVFDNHFASPGNTSVVRAGLLSQLLIENNYFEQVASPHALVPDSAASVLASGNVYDETSGPQESTGSAFAPGYPYQLTPAAELPALLREFTGPR